jgi:N-terminal acetyltransferase B complex non-catalytic subunit
VLAKVMESAHHVQPIVDTQLLAYMYRIYIEVLRRAGENPAVNSIGTSALGTWQRTAKNMQRKLDRVAMWDLLFYTAVQQDCWEDVRFVCELPIIIGFVQCIDRT